MSWFSKSQDHLPLTWWKGQPVYFAAVLALGGVASMVLTALLMAACAPVVTAMVFSWSAVVDQGRVWTILTFLLVNPPSIWVVISSYLLWRFGEDVEKFFGRRVFVRMVLIFVLAQPAMLSLFALVGIRDWVAVGMFQMELAVFLAFATLYPKAQISLILFSIEAWVLAAVILAVDALQYLAYHQWAGLVLLFGEALLSYGMVRYEQGRWAMPAGVPAFFRRFRKQRAAATKLRVVRAGPAADVSAAGVDAILEKISRHGMESLSPAEQRMLEKASEDLGGRGK